MKMRYMILALMIAAMLSLPILLIAGYDDKVISVSEARQLEDDAKVVLEGFITENLSDEMYLFSDASGEIDLEIEDKLWKDREMDPDQTVRVYGEIDREKDSIKVEVDKIKDVEVVLEEEFEEKIVE
jgi:uncharacterized protein (TIGR00156 family)